ncbi:MAG: hypothetical protein E4H14_17650 [Candidatus Thorarchaeota archaeon]|nr:MAG: hypothetical protein E4H14_17650 [Candidatus Thorarchaeota archaeon]
MVSCEGCGGEIDAGVAECPYCGRSVIQRVDTERGTIKRDGRIYGASQDEAGMTHIQFGDGQTGKRLPSGGSGAGECRRGAGSQGNIAAMHLEEKLDQIERIPDPAKHKESKDLGVTLLESMATFGDLTSIYQSSVSREAHLSTEDRERISKKEKRVKPKLKAIVTFCDKMDSKTKKKLGLSDSEVHKIKTAAARALQMNDAGKCTKCGTVNRPGTKQCKNCGAHL